MRRARSSQISSDEPPPMSNTSAKSQPKSISEAQPETASLASVSRLTMVMSSPVSARARLQELVGVGGEPAGLGGDQAGARHPVPPDLGRAHLERVQRALDGGLRQPAARGDALAEADDAGEGVDHLEAAPRGPRHQQPAVVGAEIERGIGGPGSGAPGRRPDGGCAVAGSRSRRAMRPRRHAAQASGALGPSPSSQPVPAARSTAAPSWSFVPSTTLLRRPVLQPRRAFGRHSG